MGSLMLSRSVRECKEVLAVSVVFSGQNRSGLKIEYLFLSSFDLDGQMCSLYKLALILSRRFTFALMILVSYSANCWEESYTYCLALVIRLLCVSIWAFLSYFCLLKNLFLRQNVFTSACLLTCEPARLYANSSSLLYRSSRRSFFRESQSFVVWTAFQQASSFLDAIYCSVTSDTWLSLARFAYSTISFEVFTRVVYYCSFLARYASNYTLICLSSSILYVSNSFLSNSTIYDCPMGSSTLCTVSLLIDSSSLSSQTTFSPFSRQYRLISCWMSRGLRETSSMEYSLQEGTFFLSRRASVMVISISTG